MHKATAQTIAIFFSNFDHSPAPPTLGEIVLGIAPSLRVKSWPLVIPGALSKGQKIAYRNLEHGFSLGKIIDILAHSVKVHQYQKEPASQKYHMPVQPPVITITFADILEVGIHLTHTNKLKTTYLEAVLRALK